MKRDDGYPIQYHMEVYEESFENDPCFSWATSTPFPSISVGDYFSPSTIEGWSNTPGEGEGFRVKEIEHIFWEIEGSHVGHKLMVLLEIAERS